jgi:hypothetical protein
MKFVPIWNIDLLYRSAYVALSEVLSGPMNSTVGILMREKAAK